MLIWIACVLLGLATVMFVPSILAGAIKLLSGVGKKYPVLADVGASFTLFLVGVILLGMVSIFAAVYHHLWLGTP